MNLNSGLLLGVLLAASLLMASLLTGVRPTDITAASMGGAVAKAQSSGW